MVSLMALARPAWSTGTVLMMVMLRRRHHQFHPCAHDHDGEGDRRIGGVHARGGQVTQAECPSTPCRPGSPADAEALGKDRRLQRNGADGQGERQSPQPGGQRAVAVHQL